MKKLRDILSEFEGITLKEMDSVSLLDRMDFKFVFASILLPDILKKSKEFYRVLNIGKERIFSYRSLYFDTTANKMYLDHHNGRSNRYKIRFRTYEDSDLSFLEIKYKTKNGRTIKNRVRKEKVETSLSKESMEFIKKHLPFETNDLEPKIYTSFKRITLVNKKLTERVTIDFNLNFENGKKAKDLPNLSIVEIKQDASNGSNSKLIGILDELGINPNGMSKYCIGRVLTDDNIKYNQFKKNILIINKIDKANGSSGSKIA